MKKAVNIMEEKGAWETSKFIRYFRKKEAYQREGEQKKVKVILIVDPLTDLEGESGKVEAKRFYAAL
eukprot:5441895-Lingulodinium_polyedra.AAC.1